jgi:hypothetical protein
VGHGGIAFRKEDKDLYEAFNAELKKFIGSDEHIKLVTPFGFGKDFLPTETPAWPAYVEEHGAELMREARPLPEGKLRIVLTVAAPSP